MSKTVALISANLKGFARNRMSVLLLVVFPMLIISVIFSSLAVDVPKKIPVGLVPGHGYEDVAELNGAVSSFLTVTEYASMRGCVEGIKDYRNYLCIEISGSKPVVINAYYDNTREPVIYEILQKIKSAVDFVEKQKSREIASDFLDKFDNTMVKVGKFKNDLSSIDADLDGYIAEVDASIRELQKTRSELRQTLDSMDSDLYTIRYNEGYLKTQKNNIYSAMHSYISDVRNYLSVRNAQPGDADYNLYTSIRSRTDAVDASLNNFNNAANGYFAVIDARIASYEDASRKGRQKLVDIDNSIAKLKSTKQNLYDYKAETSMAKSDIAEIENDFREIQGVDAETLVNPVVIRNVPVYNADPGAEELEIENILHGLNSLSLQIIFPKLLLLVTLFLSLLISSFVCVNYINSDAIQRIRVVKGVSMQEAASICVSSLIIMILPIFSILALGSALFGIAILPNFPAVFLIITLLSANFILFGMAIAYVIKKESITLLVSTFMLVLFVFFSGVLVPIERMNAYFAFVAGNLPLNTALEAFNKAVFYGKDVFSLGSETALLLGWLAVSAAVALGAKRLRRA